MAEPRASTSQKREREAEPEGDREVREVREARQGQELKKSSVAVIKEVYDSENYLSKFESELEQALEACCEVIVIEPDRLAEVTSRWITVGNVLHKLAFATGVASAVTGVACEPLVCVPFGVSSLLCTGIYTLSWQMDPCCNYQPETDIKRLSRMPVLAELPASKPLVLVRTENTKKIIAHWSSSLLAAAICVWRVYKTLK